MMLILNEKGNFHPFNNNNKRKTPLLPTPSPSCIIPTFLHPHNSKQPKRLIFSIEDAIPVDDDECALGHVTSSNNNYLTDLYD